MIIWSQSKCSRGMSAWNTLCDYAIGSQGTIKCSHKTGQNLHTKMILFLFSPSRLLAFGLCVPLLAYFLKSQRIQIAASFLLVLLCNFSGSVRNWYHFICEIAHRIHQQQLQHRQRREKVFIQRFKPGPTAKVNRVCSYWIQLKLRSFSCVFRSVSNTRPLSSPLLAAKLSPSSLSSSSTLSLCKECLRSVANTHGHELQLIQSTQTCTGS